METGRSSLPVLTEAITARSISGSWMADPEVHRIYGLMGKLHRMGFVHAPLIMAKEAILDPSLGPAVERIAADPERIDKAKVGLTALARRLLEEVEERGRLRMDAWTTPATKARPARLLLQKELLVWSSDMHTERGYHTSVVVPWGASDFSKQFAKSATGLSFEHAADSLILATLRSAVVAPERETRRWFVFGGDRFDALIETGAISRFTEGGKTWLALRG
jgi:hypothetical protein